MRNIIIKPKILFTCYIAIIVAYILLPSLKYNITYVETIVLSIPVVVSYSIMHNNYRKKIGIILIALLTIFVLRFLINTKFNRNIAINISIVLYLTFLPYLFAEVIRYRSDMEKILLIIIIGILIAIVMFNTWNEFASNPTVARMLARGDNEDEQINFYRASNIGGFAFSYAVGMLTPYVALWIKRSKSWKKIVFIALEIILMVYCYFTQYTTLLILSVVFSAYVLLMYNNKYSTRKVIYFLLIVVVALNISNIVLFLGDNIPLETLAEHFKGLAMTLSGGESSTSRNELTMRCIRLFFQSPFVGVELTNPDNMYIINHGHSTYAGMLASDGLIGLGAYAFAFYHIVKNITYGFSQKDIVPVIIMYIVLGMLNPNTSAEITIVVFLLIPLCEMVFYNKRKDIKNGIKKTVEN